MDDSEIIKRFKRKKAKKYLPYKNYKKSSRNSFWDFETLLPNVIGFIDDRVL